MKMRVFLQNTKLEEESSMSHYSQVELRREVEITNRQDDRDVDHLPGDKEEDQEEDAGHRHKVVGLER